MEDLAIKCKYYNGCSAPMCPLFKNRIHEWGWFPEDGICKQRPAPGWVLTQMKIAKKTKDKNKYFTYEMLNRNCRIGKGIIGLDPNKEEEYQLKEWLKMHPPKKELTKLQKDAITKRFKEAREKK